MEYLFIIAVIALVAIYYYNKLIRKNAEVNNATGSINTMLKNRYDLIPNLVDVVKNYMNYETTVLHQLTEMRTKALATDTSDDDKQQINKEISVAMRKIMVSVENYPELKASNNFLQLQESWTDLEEKISASRRFYNNAVTDYNIAIKSFPANFFSGIMGYKEKQVYEITAEESTNISSKKLFENTTNPV